MIVKNKDGELTKKEAKKEQQQKKTVKMADMEETVEVEEADPEDDLDERARLENLKKLGKKMSGKSPKTPNPKSPKNSKAKMSTTWDPVLYGGKINKEEAKRLDRTVGKPGEEEGEVQDNHLNQFVPNMSVVGRSSNLGEVDYQSFFLSFIFSICFSSFFYK